MLARVNATAIPNRRAAHGIAKRDTLASQVDQVAEHGF